MSWDTDALTAIDEGAGINAALLATNTTLRSENDDLKAENQDLKDQLANQPGPTPPPSSGVRLGYAGDDPNGKAKALRVYLNPGDPFPKPKAGVVHVVTYKGTDHANRAKQAKDYGALLYFGWTHEPENGTNNISAMNYKAGWAALDVELKKIGATNVKRIWCLMSVSFNSPTALNYWPGDGMIDVVAADGYDWCGCKDVGNRFANPNGSHRSMAQIFDKVVVFAKSKNKSVAFLEFGTPQLKTGDESGRVVWVRQTATFCKSKPQGVDVVAATYFNHDAGFKCAWALKGASQTAWEAEF